MNRTRIATLILLIALTALFRIIPHPYNFTPITAIALFGGAHFAKKRDAFLVTFLCMFISDLAIGFHSSMLAVYACFAFIVLLGSNLRNTKGMVRLWTASLSGSIIFFVVTNFSVWAFENMYAKTWAGFVECYIAALPFFQSTVLGDLFFATLLFGSFELLSLRFRSLKESGSFAFAK